MTKRVVNFINDFKNINKNIIFNHFIICNTNF